LLLLIRSMAGPGLSWTGRKRTILGNPPQNPVQWQMNDRRGQSYGEFAVAPNPPVGVNIYYYLKNQTSKVAVVIKDFNDQVVQEISSPVSGGLQKVFWNLNRQVPRDQRQQMSFERRTRANRVEPGT